MYRKLLFPLIFGTVGIAILSGLGIWQVQRLQWKTTILAEIEQRIVAQPVKLTNGLAIDMDKDQYRSVKVNGTVQAEEIHVLTSLKQVGPGFLVISPLKLNDGRLVLIDRGFIPESEKNSERILGEIKIIGNLLWPNETDHFTPDPNIEKNIWFARDLKKMSDHLGTDPILIVASNVNPPGNLIPQRIGANVANNHRSYAITWFSLAVVWFGMTILLVYRMKKHNV